MSDQRNQQDDETGETRERGGRQQPHDSRDGLRDLKQSHRSVESQVEGGQNQEEGEPHPGYGNGQGGGGTGSNG